MGMLYSSKEFHLEPCPCCDESDNEVISDENGPAAWVICWTCNTEGPEYELDFSPREWTDDSLAWGSAWRWNAYSVMVRAHGITLDWPQRTLDDYDDGDEDDE